MDLASLSDLHLEGALSEAFDLEVVIHFCTDLDADHTDLRLTLKYLIKLVKQKDLLVVSVDSEEQILTKSLHVKHFLLTFYV